MAEQQWAQSVPELLGLIAEARAELVSAFAELDEAELTAAGPEGWSIKDHIAHVTAWERIALVRYLDGKSFAEAAGMDDATSEATKHMRAETGLNDWFQARDRELALADVLERFDASYAELVARLEATPWEQLAPPEVGGHVAGNTFGHYREHAGLIRGIAGL